MKTRFLMLASASALLTPAIAAAQGQQMPHRQLDENGVDLTHGDFVLGFREASIGSGDAELSIMRRNATSRSTDWDLLTLERYGDISDGNRQWIRITTGLKKAERFMPGSWGEFHPEKADGSKVDGTYENFTYTSSQGDKIKFGWPQGFSRDSRNSNLCQWEITHDFPGCKLLPIEISRANGEKLYLTWTAHEHQDSVNQLRNISYRLGSVVNQYAYGVYFDYQSDTASPGLAPAGGWFTRVRARLVLGGLEQSQVGYSFAQNGQAIVTDPVGVPWTITDTSVASPTGPQLAVQRTGDQVTQVERNGVVTRYERTVAGSTITMRKLDALDRVTTIVSNATIGQPTSITDPANATTSFTYDVNGRLTRTTQHLGDYVEQILDARGNATEIRRVARPGSGTATIIERAQYSVGCTNSVVCNKPISTTDGRQNVTYYEYDPNHGGVTQITGPADANGIPAQTRFRYDLVAGSVNRVFDISTCRNAQACTDTVDEIRQSKRYDGQGNVIQDITASGDGTLATQTLLTYTAKGDLKSVDGPLPGSDDTTHYRYDQARRLVGTTGPDPDGVGPLRRRAQRLQYSPEGDVVVTEIGLVPGVDDTGWQSFASMSREERVLSHRRPIVSTVTGAASVVSKTQFTYDALGRLECSAVRMNPSAWSSLPPSACQLGAEGTSGPDRIIQKFYDVTDRVNQVRSGIGTSEQIDEYTSYNLDGSIASVLDGKSNRTTYSYDGLGRLKRTNYPVTAVSQGASSVSDYEELTYDAADNVTSRRLRDGNVTNYDYDNLNRPVVKDLPGAEPDVAYAYDLQGRLKSATHSGQSVTRNHDGLGRVIREAGPLGGVNSSYDTAGRRTSLSWDDGVTINYDYNIVGDLISVRENGAVGGPGVLASFTYSELGQRASMTRGNGTLTNYSYDGAQRLAGWSQDLTGGAADISVGFSRNPAGQLASRSRSNGLYAFANGANANRNYVSNGLNQYSSVGGLGLTYDARGNLTSSSGTTYTYNSENMLISSSSGATLGYDALQRLEAVDSKRFQYDGSALIAEYNSGGGLLRRYVHTPGVDEPIVWYEGQGVTDRRWLHADERGSIVAVTGADGNPVANGINTYDEFGIPGSNNIGAFQYTGQLWLPSLGMYHYKSRIYSPTHGRFLQADSIGYGDGLNLYAYAGNDPTNLQDPTGEFAEIVVTGQLIKAIVIPKVLAPVLGAFGTLLGGLFGGTSAAAQAAAAQQHRIDQQNRNNQRMQRDESDIVVNAKRVGSCAAAFAENFGKNIVDPLATVEGGLNLAGSLIWGTGSAVLSGRPPLGGKVNIDGKWMDLPRNGVRRAAIRTAGFAIRGTVGPYVIGAALVAVWQTSKDGRCQ